MGKFYEMLLRRGECNGPDPEWDFSKVTMAKLKSWVPGSKDEIYVAEFPVL